MFRKLTKQLRRDRDKWTRLGASAADTKRKLEQLPDHLRPADVQAEVDAAMAGSQREIAFYDMAIRLAATAKCELADIRTREAAEQLIRDTIAVCNRLISADLKADAALLYVTILNHPAVLAQFGNDAEQVQAAFDEADHVPQR